MRPEGRIPAGLCGGRCPPAPHRVAPRDAMGAGSQSADAPGGPHSRRPGDHYNTAGMATVAIVGAGELGGALAHKLAARDRIGSLCLIDASPGVAAGKALDIRQSGPIERFGTRVRAGAIDAVVGAGVVVVADPAAPADGERPGAPPAPAVMERIAGLTGSAPIVCAGAAAGRLVAWSVHELGVGRARIVGSAPEALAAGLRALIALEADVSPAQVAVQVLGTPPEHPVVAWSSASVAGGPLGDRLSRPALARVRRRVEGLWPSGPYALASAAARVVEALAAGGSRRVFTCFVADDARRPGSARAAAVTLHAGGVGDVVEPVLSPSERVLLDNALEPAP